MRGRLSLLPVLVPVLAGALLGACAGAESGGAAATRPLGPDFGDAVRQNEAAQIVDPDPAGRTARAPAFDGKRAAAALSRYQNGAVRALEIERTADRRAE
jgi:hypothetical protein